jgi:hypothetical protein
VPYLGAQHAGSARPLSTPPDATFDAAEPFPLGVLAVGHIPTVRYWRPYEAGAVEQFDLQSVLGYGFTVKE